MATISGSGFGVGQACTNGHQTTGDVNQHPTLASPFCSQCGAKTIIACPGCSAPIRGHQLGVMGDGWTLPAFCLSCGAPFPWTRA
jgi:hypothetical protein